ncbi:curved DNA-binding protein [bacterium BMS3Bbin11]|nr:curved DNA-binding protein [bacterium BMS3Abin11]GBE45691.1 curved DNA-binding protein [bacterium BMS3Bbin11]GMT40424.1 MAG: curved DNA-binding protein [bacterium]HDH09151.1 J domain-containing protein [Gammaproteobacteria bacterium]HDH15661.1 J domain-containing protein [Gammaproteobacteria bacterium]
MEYKDYYKIMGVKRDATQDEIKRSYRKLARKYHPDVSKASNAEERFKEVGEAYEVLKDPEKRAAYDQLGSNWQQGQDFQPPPGWQDGFEFSGGGYTEANSAHFSDFFEDLFGRAGGAGFQQGRQYSFQMKGEDHHAKVGVSLEDAYHGATRAITLKMPEVDASGHLVTRERKLNIKIPKGVTQGQRIRLRGQGGPGSGDAPAGDLYLEIDLLPHSIYTVDGRDIYVDLPVSPWEAALGEKVSIPTLGGKVEMKIPAGSQSGSKLRLKGRGIPAKKKGDQFVVLKIVTPEAKTEKQKKLYRQMREEMNFNPRSRLGV